jgi:glucokinase
VKAWVIALDVGGSSVKSAVVSTDGQLLRPYRQTPIDSGGSADAIFHTLVWIVRAHLAEVTGEEGTLQGVALGFPGPFDYATGVSRIRGVAKFESIYGKNVAEALRRRLPNSLLPGPGLPIRFRNDAEAAITGEARYGAGQGIQRLIGLTLGTGCGSAFLVDGEPVTEGEGAPPNGWLYPFPFRGERADDLFSIRGLIARLNQTNLPNKNIRAAATEARRGDPVAGAVFAQFGADLGEFLAPFVASFRADGVLILGGLAHNFDIFGPTLASSLTIPILPGQLGEEAPLLGAAALFAR